MFRVNEGLFPISNLISSLVIKRVGLGFFVFRRNDQLTDTVRSAPGRNSKHKRKTEEDLISLSLFSATQILSLPLEAKHLLIPSGTEM